MCENFWREKEESEKVLFTTMYDRIFILSRLTYIYHITFQYIRLFAICENVTGTINCQLICQFGQGFVKYGLYLKLIVKYCVQNERRNERVKITWREKESKKCYS